MAKPQKPDPDCSAGDKAHKAIAQNAQARTPPPAPARSASIKATLAEEWKDGDVLLDDYRVIRLLGRGGMGRVYLVETVTPPRLRYAVKILANRLLQKDHMKRQFLREMNIAGLIGNLANLHYPRGEYDQSLAMFDATVRILTTLVDQTDSTHDLQQLSVN